MKRIAMVSLWTIVYVDDKGNVEVKYNGGIK